MDDIRKKTEIILEKRKSKIKNLNREELESIACKLLEKQLNLELENEKLKEKNEKITDKFRTCDNILQAILDASPDAMFIVNGK